MPYQVSAVTSMANLKSTIESFAVTNGWSLASDVLSKGSSHIELLNEDVNDVPRTELLRSRGANSADMLTEPCSRWPSIYIPTANWPFTAHLFAHTSPDTIVVIVNYNVDFYQFLAWGDLEKVGTYTGGNWYTGSWFPSISITGQQMSTTTSGSSITAPGAPFWTPYLTMHNNAVHAEIDSKIWWGEGTSSALMPDFIPPINPLQNTGPNLWNGQTVLNSFKIWVQISGLHVPLGRLGHIRQLRIDNYNPGDIISLAPDEWKVFPFYKKDPCTNCVNASGNWGWAIEYDGP